MWIGHNAVILPGVHIGEGAIIGANSIIGSNVDPYTIAVGNPAKELRKRFDKEMIDLFLGFKWWDKSVEESNDLIPILTCSDLSKVKAELEKRIDVESDTSFSQFIQTMDIFSSYDNHISSSRQA